MQGPALRLVGDQSQIGWDTSALAREVGQLDRIADCGDTPSPGLERSFLDDPLPAGQALRPLDGLGPNDGALSEQRHDLSRADLGAFLQRVLETFTTGQALPDGDCQPWVGREFDSADHQAVKTPFPVVLKPQEEVMPRAWTAFRHQAADKSPVPQAKDFPDVVGVRGREEHVIATDLIRREDDAVQLAGVW